MHRANIMTSKCRRRISAQIDYNRLDYCGRKHMQRQEQDTEKVGETNTMQGMLDSTNHCPGQKSGITIKFKNSLIFFVLPSFAVCFSLFYYMPATVTCLLVLGISIVCHGIEQAATQHFQLLCLYSLCLYLKMFALGF